MCKFSLKSCGGGGGLPFQALGDLTWNDPKGIKETISTNVLFMQQEELSLLICHAKY